MTRWLHPPELERQRERDEFDPVVEGARHGLARELSLAIWKRVCADATDSFGRRDTEQAERRFHEIAVRIATRGGKLRPDVGRLTRVETEITGKPLGVRGIDELAPRVPGRETLVTAEARRWGMLGEASAATQGAEAGTASPELPGASEVAQAMAALQVPLRPDQARLLAPSVGARMSRLFDFNLAGVEVVPESPAVTGSTKAVTKDDEVHFRSGAYQPGTPDGDWLIAHELAHVVQQRGGRGERPGTRKALEREADRAATLVAHGQAAPILLRAERAVAYAFDEGEKHDSGLDDATADKEDVRADARGGDAAKLDAKANANEAAHPTGGTTNDAANDHADHADHAESGMDEDAVASVSPVEVSPAVPAGAGGGHLPSHRRRHPTSPLPSPRSGSVSSTVCGRTSLACCSDRSTPPHARTSLRSARSCRRTRRSR